MSGNEIQMSPGRADMAIVWLRESALLPALSHKKPELLAVANIIESLRAQLAERDAQIKELRDALEACHEAIRPGCSWADNP